MAPTYNLSYNYQSENTNSCCSILAK